MTLTQVDFGSLVQGTTSATPTSPGGYSATNGDLACIFVIHKRTGNGGCYTTDNTWTMVDSDIGGTGTQAADTGPTRIQLFVKRITGGSITWPAIQCVSHTGASIGVVSAIYRSTSGNYFVAESFVSDTSSATSFGGTGDTKLPFKADDHVAVVSALMSDSPTYTAASISATGATFSSLTEDNDAAATSGDDMRFGLHYGTVTAGAATAAPVTSFTTSVSATGSQMIILIREAPAPVAGSSAPTIRDSTADADGNAPNNAPAKPSGLTVDDLMLAWTNSDNDGTMEEMTAPSSNWVQLCCMGPTDQGTGAGIGWIKLWYCIATSTETAASTFTFADNTGANCATVLVAITAGTFDPNNPFTMPETNKNDGSNTTPHTAPSIPDGVTNGLKLVAYFPETSGTGRKYASAPPGFTEVEQINPIDTGGSDSYVTTSVFAKVLGSNGATGTVNATPPVSLPYGAISIVVNPVPAVGGSTEFGKMFPFLGVGL